ncbi:MAG TPA: galactokinase [Vicinamibacterales bacterium]|nr:galactokinase [Vicinamibacterales bacterium]
MYRAPGRVNLIGEHTDYNDGFVLPMALDRSTWVEASPRCDRLLVVHSRERGETLTVDLDDNPPAPTGSWVDYVRGMGAVLEDANGADLSIASDVPIGAGLSSSAALEIACGYALLDIAGRPIDLEALARAGQRAEHRFVGTRCGLMDQTIACFGRAGHALLLDTRSFERRYVPIPGSVRVIVGNTMVRHAHASGEYNARRADCEEGVAVLVRRRPGIRALRDARIEDLEAARGELSNRVWQRCHHVVTENARTLRAADALASGDFVTMGRLMCESHESLSLDYEVSCPELDVMTMLAQRIEGVYGARMTGGGFGGSIVALVDAPQASRVQHELKRRYTEATGRDPDVWICAAGGGVDKTDARVPAPAL